MTPRAVSFENLHRQYLICRRHKRNTLNALRLRGPAGGKPLDLQAALVNRTYAPSRSSAFSSKTQAAEISGGLPRPGGPPRCWWTIWERIGERSSSRFLRLPQGKGVHAGVERLTRFIARSPAMAAGRPGICNWTSTTISCPSTSNSVRPAGRQICDEEPCWLTRVLVFHDCTENFVIKGDRPSAEQNPAHKTLFHRAEGQGLPIGNLNSQFLPMFT